MSDIGWVVTPKPAIPELAEGYPAPPFDATVVASEQPELPEPTSLHAGDHIRDWASFVELAGPEGMALLAKAVR